MNINATLLGQMITFLIFVLFTMKFVWPPLMKVLAERKKKIAEGLMAAERGVRELEVAKHKAGEMMRDAKIQAASIVDKANKRAHQIIEEAKEEARAEGERLLALAQEGVQQEILAAQHMLKEHAANLAIAGAERILRREIDTAANTALINDMIKEIEHNGSST